MMKKKIFLSGPIRGISRHDSLSWRKEATLLLNNKFNIIHALRGREKRETFTDPKTAVIRDLNDIVNSDIILVNDSIENCSMIGTFMEVFFAYQQNKPVIIFGNAHEKDYWLDYHSHLRTSSLIEACYVLNTMFNE